MDNAKRRLELEDKIKEMARMVRAQADATAAASRTSPEVLLTACDKLSELSDGIKVLAESVRRILESEKTR